MRSLEKRERFLIMFGPVLLFLVLYFSLTALFSHLAEGRTMNSEGKIMGVFQPVQIAYPSPDPLAEEPNQANHPCSIMTLTDMDGKLVNDRY